MRITLATPECSFVELIKQYLYGQYAELTPQSILTFRIKSMTQIKGMRSDTSRNDAAKGIICECVIDESQEHPDQIKVTWICCHLRKIWIGQD